VETLNLFDFYANGINFTAPLTIPTLTTFMRVYHYRRVIKPFNNAAATSLNAFHTASTTVEIDLDINIHLFPLIFLAIIQSSYFNHALRTQLLLVPIQARAR
jgi:hypothetical protein